jgi:hypothetical protein
MRILVVGPDRESFAGFAGALAELARRGHDRRLVVAQQRRVTDFRDWDPLAGPAASGSDAAAVAARVSCRRLFRQVRADLVLVLEGRHQTGLAGILRLARAQNLPVVVRFPPAGSGYEESPAARNADWALVATEFDRAQVAEKLQLPPYRIVSTGALDYDHWFDSGPIVDRNELCSQLGLSSGPYAIYRSAPAHRAVERDTLQSWIRAVQSDANHPFRGHEILIADTALTVDGWNPPAPGVDKVRILETKTGLLRDAIAHSSAVLSGDPRGLIEAVILRKPALVLTRRGGTIGPVPLSIYLDPAYADRTEPVKSAESADASLEDDERRRFLELAVRPYGLSLPASHVVALALEKMAVIGPCRPFISHTVVSIARPLLSKLAEAAERGDAARRQAEYARRVLAKEAARVKTAVPWVAVQEQVARNASRALARAQKEAGRAQKEAVRAAKETSRAQKERAGAEKAKARAQKEAARAAKEAARARKTTAVEQEVARLSMEAKPAEKEKARFQRETARTKKGPPRRGRIFLNRVIRGSRRVARALWKGADRPEVAIPAAPVRDAPREAVKRSGE